LHQKLFLNSFYIYFLPQWLFSSPSFGGDYEYFQ
jgi:hypothetical protein